MIIMPMQTKLCRTRECFPSNLITGIIPNVPRIEFSNRYFCFILRDQYGAMFFNRHKAGIGFILRDQYGEVLLAASILENEVLNPETIECMAVLGGIQPCLNQGISRSIIECDCMLVVNELEKNEDSLSSWCNLVQEIR